MDQYWLSEPVFYCSRGRRLVFLDLHTDSYTLVDGEAAKTIEAISLKRLPATRTLQAQNVLTELLNAGLLTTDETRGKSLCPTAVDMPTQSLIDLQGPPAVTITLRHMTRFLWANVIASFKLRRYRLEKTVNAVSRRREHRALNELDIACARKLVAIFLKLRFLFPRNYLCLYDSLALIEFLAAYGVHPSWTFAVRLEPWAAHCWVQHGCWIFNEELEAAAGYTVIMSV